ncbi:hypothetical protein CEXT_196861 [Caerostris extrusa]|uniref:Uncharacterized protein n=1 Tax=Caerostris extrusa TaxID=172846 RepID=A0AAV4Y8T7_CAEEX|nr:hypothetical protein CEXT_196861 [Caerostris extrusa]
MTKSLNTSSLSLSDLSDTLMTRNVRSKSRNILLSCKSAERKNRPDKEPPIRNHLPICHGMTNHNELIRLSRRSSLCSKRPIMFPTLSDFEDVLQESCFTCAPSVIRIVRVRFQSEDSFVILSFSHTNGLRSVILKIQWLFQHLTLKKRSALKINKGKCHEIGLRL